MTVLAEVLLRCDRVSDSRDSTDSEKNIVPDDDPPRGVASPVPVPDPDPVPDPVPVPAAVVWLAAGEAAWFDVGGAWQTVACWL